MSTSNIAIEMPAGMSPQGTKVWINGREIPGIRSFSIDGQVGGTYEVTIKLIGHVNVYTVGNARATAPAQDLIEMFDRFAAFSERHNAQIRR